MKSITKAITPIITMMQATPPGGGFAAFDLPRAGLNFAGLYFAIVAMVASGAALDLPCHNRNR
jgi:hypothetical protein